MKKLLAFILAVTVIMSAFAMVAQAGVGDIIGTALHTDIVVYINHYAVPSYIVNGQSVIVAEDLVNFGFDVIWNGNARTLDIKRNSNQYVNIMHVGKGYTKGTKYTDIRSTDIAVYADGKKVTSYNINGYTMIPVEELTMFGEIIWVPGERALKMWVEGLDMLKARQPVSHKTYNGTSIPDFGWITGAVCAREAGSVYDYFGDYGDVQEYEKYIKQNGWKLDKSVKNNNGIWVNCYVNPKQRTGVAIVESYGIVSIQIGTNMDYWKSEIK